MRKKKARKFFIIFLFLFILTIAFLINNRIKDLERKDITNAAEQYVTTGYFNKYKLFKIDHYHLLFSDNNNAILEVKGMECKVPHGTRTYKLTMSKDADGLWYVKTLAPVSDTANNHSK